MRIFKHGHSCVRLEAGDHAVVVDPGMFTDAVALEGATAVLVTHEHPDHWTPDALRATDAPVFTIEAVAAQIQDQAADVAERVTVVRPGETFDVGLPVRAVGEKHAVIHPELPHFDNSGYLFTVDGTSVFHPGDALTVPDETPDLLLLPVSAPWLKISECIDYAREVAAPRSLAIHDAIYSQAGLGVVQGGLTPFPGARELGYVRLAPGEELR
ncbi:MAG: MBL fold metallo-hydrolase [Propionibacteriales bacterium]|nr:MBL fold metallo-hydrolase [Propionibacteriales bacterium]